jgi:hypothetical protein
MTVDDRVVCAKLDGRPGGGKQLDGQSLLINSREGD